MSANLSYIVMHPRREEFAVSAMVLQRGQAVPRRAKVRILADAIEGNHDPCVLTDPWFYSYCHASHLRRSVMGEGSMLFFLDHSRRVFDTVFVVRRKLRWERLQPRRPPLPVPIHLTPEMSSLAWSLHFKWPSRGYHENTSVTFEGNSWGDGRHSFLPFRDEGPVSEAEVVPASVRNKIKSALPGKHPLALTREEAEVLYDRITRASTMQVVGGIKLLLDSDRQQIGVDPAEGPHRTRSHCGRC